MTRSGGETLNESGRSAAQTRTTVDGTGDGAAEMEQNSIKDVDRGKYSTYATLDSGSSRKYGTESDSQVYSERSLLSTYYHAPPPQCNPCPKMKIHLANMTSPTPS